MNISRQLTCALVQWYCDYQLPRNSAFSIRLRKKQWVCENQRRFKRRRRNRSTTISTLCKWVTSIRNASCRHPTICWADNPCPSWPHRYTCCMPHSYCNAERGHCVGTNARTLTPVGRYKLQDKWRRSSDWEIESRWSEQIFLNTYYSITVSHDFQIYVYFIVFFLQDSYTIPYWKT